MKRLIQLAIILLASHGAWATPFDSLVVKCKIVDGETGALVSAELRYESLPYGNKIGFRKGSECNIRMESTDEYTVYVKADGYMPLTVTLKQADFAGIHQVEHEIKLTQSKVGKIMRLESLNFAQGSDEITSEMYSELDKLVLMLQGAPSMQIQLEGHTDYNGDPKLNMKLSEDRVQAVRNYLVSKGIEKDRIAVKAFGGTKPLSTENTAQAHALNRRVEVRITSN